MNAIYLQLTNQGWMATYAGPHADRIWQLFGTPTVPTAFTAEANVFEVVAQIEASNPGVMVYV